MISKTTSSSLPTPLQSSSLSSSSSSSTTTTTTTTLSSSLSTKSSLPRLSNENNSNNNQNNDKTLNNESNLTSSLPLQQENNKKVLTSTSLKGNRSTTSNSTVLIDSKTTIVSTTTIALTAATTTTSLTTNTTSGTTSTSLSGIITTPNIRDSSKRKTIINNSDSNSNSNRKNRDSSLSNSDKSANLFPENSNQILNKNEYNEKSPDLSKRTYKKIHSNSPPTEKDNDSLLQTIDTSKRIPEITKRNLNKIGNDQDMTLVLDKIVDISQISQSETMAESLTSLKSKLGNLQLPRSMGNKSKSLATLSTSNVVIIDQIKASKNDQIVQERLQEGKALNRKDVNGATMHTFSLWSNVQPTTTIQPNKLQSEVSNNQLLPSFQFQSQPHACTSSGFQELDNYEADLSVAPDKKLPKARGPKAAIDLVVDYNDREDRTFARERSSSAVDINTSGIDISKPPVRHNSISGAIQIHDSIPTSESVGGESGGYDDDFDDEDDGIQKTEIKNDEIINDFVKPIAGLGSGLALALRIKVGNAKNLTQSTESLPVLEQTNSKNKERNSDPDITIEKTGSEGEIDPECFAYETLSFDIDDGMDSLAYSVEEDEELLQIQTARYSSNDNRNKKSLGATYPRSNSANTNKKAMNATGGESFKNQGRCINPFAANPVSKNFIPIRSNLTEMNLKDSNSKISDDNVKNDIQRSIDASSPLSELSHEEKEIEVKPEKKKSISENRNIKTPENSQLQWKRGEPIGQGTFGTVYKGLNERTGELLAIKEICLVDGSESDVKELRKEISIMWDLDHENIVRYIGTAQTERYLYIIIEYISGGSIASMLAQFGAFSENLVRRFTHQVLCGVEYLHAKGIIHRDIKGANVLVTESGVAKLADFGCSKQLVGMCTASFEESLRAIRGSVPWMAPEIIKQEGHGRSSDIWSVGATVIEMATGKPPWPEFKDNLAALFHVATSKEPPPPPSHVSKHCAKFISQCMAIDAKDRLSAKELLEHDPFMKSEREKQSNFELNTTSSYSTVPTELSDSPVSPARSAYENSLALSMQS